LTAAAATPIRVEVVSTTEELHRLGPEWEELRSRSLRATPFQSAAWALPWWHAFGTGVPQVLTLRLGDRLVALVPLFLQREAEGNGRLLLIGTGNTDRLDALTEPGFEAAMVKAVAALVAELPKDCTEVDLWQLPPGSPLLRVSPANWRSHHLEGEPCPVVSLRAMSQRLDDVLPQRFGRKLHQYRRRLARVGAVAVESGEGKSVEALHELFCELVRLHGAVWSARGQPGGLADARVERFHREIIRTTRDQDLLDLYGLRLNGRLVAAYYGFRDTHGAYYYLGGYDGEFASLSVGTLVIAAALEHALERRAVVFDFLRGRESYKYRWGAQDSPTVRLRLTR
jgi:CelD/BcsL family acetyltransferase involved in cellulose biosynthesis